MTGEVGHLCKTLLSDDAERFAQLDGNAVEMTRVDVSGVLTVHIDTENTDDNEDDGAPRIRVYLNQEEELKMTDRTAAMRETFDSIVKEAQAMAFFYVLKQHPKATVEEIAELAEDYEMSHLALGEMLLGKQPATAQDWIKRLSPGSIDPKQEEEEEGEEEPATTRRGGRRKKKPKKRASSSKTPTIGKSAGERDETILSWLQDNPEWHSTGKISIEFDLDKVAVRSSLSRLLESGDISQMGKTRGRKYQAK